MTLPLPRYFISRPAAPAAGNAFTETLPPTHVVDNFLLGNRHTEAQEWAITLDCLGRLQAAPEQSWQSLPPEVQHELAFHEMSGTARARLLEAAEFYLFNLQLLEQPPGTPGSNDPVYLYGTLYGPYPAAHGRGVHGVEGQLTVTRGDVLEGLVKGAAQAFRYANPQAAREMPKRCLQMLLPGEREEELRRGAGLVLAYPLLPPELSSEPANEFVVTQLLYDLLSALKDDLERERIKHPLRAQTLPVPSRLNLEQQLLAEGYEIKGDTAFKQVKTKDSAPGWLKSVFGALLRDKLTLPPEGTVEQFLALAQRALADLPNWPTPRALALRECLKPGPSGQRRARTAPPPLPPRVPQTSAPLRQNLPRPQPQDWMQDFIAAHRQGAAPSRLTSTATGNRRIVPPADQQPAPHWMQDFAPEQMNKNAPAQTATPPKHAPTDPDWLNDFK